MGSGATSRDISVDHYYFRISGHMRGMRLWKAHAVPALGHKPRRSLFRSLLRVALRVELLQRLVAPYCKVSNISITPHSVIYPVSIGKLLTDRECVPQRHVLGAACTFALPLDSAPRPFVYLRQVFAPALVWVLELMCALAGKEAIRGRGRGRGRRSLCIHRRTGICVVWWGCIYGLVSTHEYHWGV